MGPDARVRCLQSSSESQSTGAMGKLQAPLLSASMARATQDSKDDRPVYGGVYGAVYRNVLTPEAGDVSYRHRGKVHFVGQQRDIGCEPPYYCFPRPFWLHP